MNDFIAPDEEVQEELRAEQERKRRKRAQRRNEKTKNQEASDSDDGIAPKSKNRKRRIEKEKEELDSDDYELLREATGGVKKGRLKKVGDEGLKKEESKMKIDTTADGRRKQRMEMP